MYHLLKRVAQWKKIWYQIKQCFKLFVTTQLKVLKSVPWNNVDIQLLGVEVAHAGEVFDGSKEEILNHLERNGFVYKVFRTFF